MNPFKSKLQSLAGAFIFTFLISANAQEVKNYNGVYKGKTKEGTATYQYYESNYERILHGTFTYTVGKTLNILGQYSQGKKDGVWKTTATALPTTAGAVTGTATGRYELGNMEGAWTMSSSSKAATTGKAPAASAQTPLEKTTSNVNFIKNNLTGNFEYTVNNVAGKTTTNLLSITGRFDSKGYFEGMWTIKILDKKIPYEDIRKYHKGVLYWEVYRNLSSGEIISKMDSTLYVNKFFSDYDTLNNNKDKALKLAPLTSGKMCGYNNLSMKRAIDYWTNMSTDEAFNMVYEVSQGITANKVSPEMIIVENEDWKLNNEQRRKKEAEETEKTRATEAKFKDATGIAEAAFAAGDYVKAIEFYKNALVIKSSQFLTDQIKIAEQKIAEEREAKERAKAKELDDAYLASIEKADNFYNIREYPKALAEYKKAYGIKPEKYASDQIAKIEPILNAEQKKEEDKIKAIILKQQDDFWVAVDAGNFTMGCMKNDTSCLKNEKPNHEVTLEAFQISASEVTVKQYRAFCKAKGLPEPEGDDETPVANVSWEDAKTFAEWLNCRLPTEAEWEYAARGGQFRKKTKFSGNDDLDKVAWCYENAGNKANTVMSKKPNSLFIFDMTGNVWEWCSDWYSADYYASSPKENPQGPILGTQKVIRGGSFTDIDAPTKLRVTYRGTEDPQKKARNIGFRLVKKEQ